MSLSAPGCKEQGIIHNKTFLFKTLLAERGLLVRFVISYIAANSHSPVELVLMCLQHPQRAVVSLSSQTLRQEVCPAF